MQRQCAWFGCNTVAAATYTFDAGSCTVWLDIPFEGSARAGDLCDRHARSLTPPRGWLLEDRRTSGRGARNGERPAAPAADPDADPEAELRTLLDAHSPLLARAFRSSGAN